MEYVACSYDSYLEDSKVVLYIAVLILFFSYSSALERTLLSQRRTNMYNEI